MSHTDVRGHTVPDGTDPARRQSILDLSASIPSIHTVSSLAEATRYVAALTAEGIPVDSAHPVYVWRTDWEAIGVWDGSVWRYIRESASGVMTGEIDYGLTSGQWAAMVPGGGQGARVRGGMTVGTAFVPPRTGLYEIGGHLLLSASSSETTRVDVGAAVNGAAGMGPASFTSLVFATTAQIGMPVGSIALQLSAGDVVQLRARQLLTSGRVRIIRGSFSLKEM